MFPVFTMDSVSIAISAVIIMRIYDTMFKLNINTICTADVNVNDGTDGANNETTAVIKETIKEYALPFNNIEASFSSASTSLFNNDNNDGVYFGRTSDTKIDSFYI